LKDTTFSQKNADNIQKYVKKAGRKINYVNSLVSTELKYRVKVDFDASRSK
jgi:hypothetical protein